MLKRKLKKILIILLLLIMVVQIVPISYAATDEWNNMTEDEKLDAVFNLSAGPVNETTIKDFLTKYGITANDLQQYVYKLEQMFPDQTGSDLFQTPIEQLMQGTGEIAQNGTTNVGDVDTFGEFIDGIAGVLFIGIKILPAAIGKVLSLIMNGVSGEKITVYNVLFNKVDLTSINFFDSTTGSSTVDTIKQNVAIWYVGIRNLAAVILALILIYVAIRMAISTIAEDKAKYKTMLLDWITSLCLLFVLHYIMIFTINLNNTLVDLLSKAGSSIDLTYVEEILFGNAIFGGFIEGLGNSFAYMMLVGMSFTYFFSYVRRMITLAFLIIIAPLITVTYSIDKMGDGKSQALNTWLKEFVYNILIQPFQCIIYLSLVTSVLGMLTGTTPTTAKVNLEQDNIKVASIENDEMAVNDIDTNVIIEDNDSIDTVEYRNIIKINRASGTDGDGTDQNQNNTNGEVNLISVFIAIYVLMFMYQAEEIVKKIFGFQAESMGKTLASAAITSTLISKGSALFKGGNNNNNKVGAPTQYKKRPVTPRQSNAGGDNPGDSNSGGGTPGGSNPGDSNAGGSNSGDSNPGGSNPGGGTPGGSNPGGSTPGGNNPGTSANSNAPKKKIGGPARNIGGKLLRGNISAGLGLAGMAFGLGATGQLSGGVAGAGLGGAASGAINRSLDKSRDKRNEKLRQAQIARDIDAYKEAHEGEANINNRLYQLMNDWIEGTAVPEDDDDAAMELYHHIMEHKDGLRESGLSEDDAKDSLDRLFQNTFSGDQSREDPKTLTDNVLDIVKRMTNRFTN